jgi:glucokinase
MSSFLGIDIGGTKTAISILNESSGVLAKDRFPTCGKNGPEQVVQKMIETGYRLAEGNEVAGIGISVGAMFDPVKGCFGDAPHLPGWKGYPVVSAFKEAFSLPVAADNDANACALAEWRYGAGKGTQHMAFLTFGTGLGAGLILNGRLYRGASALAGEIGATRVAEDGPHVRGKPGCLEGFASGAGIAGLVERALKDYQGETCLRDRSSAREVAKGALAGDGLCLSILNDSGDYLGRGLAILMDLLNLEVIVIGSIFTRCEALLRPSMDAAIERDAMPLTRAACRIVPAALGEQIGDYAALALAVGIGN